MNGADLPTLTVLRWVAAAAPVLILFALVLQGRFRTSVIAVGVAGGAAAVALAAFGADVELVAVGAGKGLWTGVWILYVIWPALLLYQLANRAGLGDIGEQLACILPTRTENLLIVAWVLPSFVQGVAGFGTPIAVAAPLLVAMGCRRQDAVALPLVGYHWAVTFGSMGSSFYMGALTAHLTGVELAAYATKASGMLATNTVMAGVLVCLMIDGRRALREGLPMVVVTGTTMAVTLFITAQVEPSIASVSAGAAGLLTVPVLRAVHRRRTAPAPALQTAGAGAGSTGWSAPDDGPVDHGWGWLRVLAPYGVLLVLVLPVFIVTASRDFVKGTFLVGPSFGSTSTSYGLVNPPVPSHSPIALFGHPGTYLLAAALIGAALYLWQGMLRRADVRPAVGAWVRQALAASPAVLALAALAGIMVESGMVRLMASGVVAATGPSFPALSGTLGAVGSFATGSTTTSNALLAALQREVADLIHQSPSTLVASQTAGGNVGNSLAPVVILVGAGAVGAADQMGEILRAVLKPALVLLVVVTLMTATIAWL